ncbi:MAG TPA: protein kinase [Polyangia bacterium]
MGAVVISPERFGRYILLDRIGEGGMAEVFRAIMPGAEGFKHTLVVKRILSPHSQSAEFVDMFVREARIGAMLNHPNIVQVCDFGCVDGHYFLAMEYLRGRDVLAIIRRLHDAKLPFPLSLAAFIAHEVAGGLAYAHALTGPDGRSFDIVHRDVSPANVMCLREGGVKLLDFGVAKGVGEFAHESTEQGIFKGKLAYMSPERVRSEPVDGRSDLYSLGVVLWEMLTSRRLFRGASEIDTFKNILELTVPPPSSLRSDIPSSLDNIVMHAIERDRSKRYASGQAMADDLEEVLRETKFKSRMLPKFLVELFGSALQSRQVTLSDLTPGLLAAVGVPEKPDAEAGSILGLSVATPISRWKSPRLWGICAAAVIAALVALVVGGASNVHEAVPSAMRARPAVPGTTPASATVEPVASVQVLAEPALRNAVQATAVVEDPPALASPAANKPKRPIAGRRSASVSTHADDDAIGSGLSIDPFKEAATRGHP